METRYFKHITSKRTAVYKGDKLVDGRLIHRLECGNVEDDWTDRDFKERWTEINTSETQTVKDAIAFGEYLRELNPNYDLTLVNFLRTQPQQALLNSEEIDIAWFNYLDQPTHCQ